MQLVFAVFLTATFGLTRPVLTSENCSPYGDPQSSQCATIAKRTDYFLVLDKQLEDAVKTENLTEFVVNTTLGMYKYLHPCAQILDAALVLFYDDAPEILIGRRNEMAAILEMDSVDGRGKRQYTFMTDDDLLKKQLENLVRYTDAGCVQFLIEKYKNISAQTFKSNYPNFLIPTTAVPTTLTPLTSGMSSRTIPGNVTATTPHTTSVGTVSHRQASCSTCSGLMCLLGAHVNACPDGQFFCLTTIQETTSGRHISRGCSSQTLCDDYNLHQNYSMCSQADQQILPTGITCRFCCLGDNCNKPPDVIPEPSTLYSARP